MMVSGNLRAQLRSQAIGVLVLWCLLPSVGCTPAPERSPTSLSVAKQFSRTGSTSSEARWWLEFRDPHLNDWVARGLGANDSLGSAWARLTQARFDARVVSADALPALDGQLDANYKDVRGPVANSTADGASWSMGVVASYEVDLWGSIGAEKRDARERAEAARFDVETVAISITAEIAIAWYRWIEAREQSALRAGQTETNRQVLALVEARYSRGLVSARDVFRQRQLIDAAQHAEYAATAEAARWRNRLAFLLGRVVGELRMPDDARLPDLTALPALGTPVTVIQRRPDLRAAMHRLAAQDALVAVAVAQRYPRLSLRASMTTSTETVSSLFSNWLSALAANVLAPLWDGGRRKARAQSARAAAKAAWYSYAAAATEAVKEVEDALIRDQELTRETQSISRQLELARRGLEVARAGYASGRASYLQILDAVLTLQDLERRHLMTRRVAIEARIALHRAVAGPIDPPDRS